MKRVMAFGTFDFLHSGHLFYLRQARALGNELVVVVSRDRNARILKGKTPLNNENDRLALVRELKLVDKAVLGDHIVRDWGMIKKFHPAIIALGYDQWASIPSLRKELDEAGLHAEIVRIKPFKPSKNKSSLLKSR